MRQLRFGLVQWEGFYIFALQQLFRFDSVHIDFVADSLMVQVSDYKLPGFLFAHGQAAFDYLVMAEGIHLLIKSV